ncbi:MAG TPA: hypothetical protein VNN15_03445 [Solirubrobacterales bacterium]|nr:hypothetical protein [Solirubrobacterales bacterium]
MCRKLIHLGLALAAWGAVALAPTFASASPVMTFPLGTPLATGSLLQVTNAGVSLFTEPEGRIECLTVKFTGELSANSEGGVAVNLSSMEARRGGVEEDCKRDWYKNEITQEGSVKITYSGLPWCFKTAGIDEFQIRGGSCTGSKKPVTLVFTYTGLAECKYEASSFHGTFTTAPEDVRLLSEQGFEKESTNSFFCPATMGSDTELTMEKDAPTNEPVYIS